MFRYGLELLLWTETFDRESVRLIGKAARSGGPARSAIVASLLVLIVVHHPVRAARAPTEDSLWYYEIGGAEPVSAPANPSITTCDLLPSLPT